MKLRGKKVRTAYFNALIHDASIPRDSFSTLIHILTIGCKGWNNMTLPELKDEVVEKYKDELTNIDIDVTNTRNVENYFLKNYGDADE